MHIKFSCITRRTLFTYDVCRSKKHFSVVRQNEWRWNRRWSQISYGVVKYCCCTTSYVVCILRSNRGMRVHIYTYTPIYKNVRRDGNCMLLYSSTRINVCSYNTKYVLGRYEVLYFFFRTDLPAVPVVSAPNSSYLIYCCTGNT